MRFPGRVRRFFVVVCAVISFSSALFSISCFAGVVYEYREAGSHTVIGTLESGSSGPVALFLDDAVFGLGSADLLSVGGILTLDGEDISIIFPTVVPLVPTDPSIHRSLLMSFSSSPGDDIVAVATESDFPDGSIVISDQFIGGDWVAQIPEPGTLILVAIGLVGVGWSAKRTRGSARTTPGDAARSA